MAPPNPFKSLDLAQSDGPGLADHLNQVYPDTTMIVEVSNFTGTQLDVQLQVSHDGTNWIVAATAVATANGVYQVTFHGVVLYTRANLLLLGSSATVSATVASA